MIKSGTHFIFLMYLKRCLVETKRFCRITNAVSVLHQDEGGFGKSTPNAVEISRGLSSREILSVKGNLEGGGDGFPNTSRVLVEYGHSLIIINLSTGSGSENPSLWTGKD